MVIGPNHSPASVTPKSICNLGPIISDGTPLTHTFRVHNNSGHSIRILDKMRSASCCLDFGPLPELIGPDQVFEIPVLMKTAGKAGALYGEFGIRTDHPTEPLISLIIQANLLTDRELIPLKVPQRIAAGKSSDASWLLIIRQRVGEAITWPTCSGLSARYTDEPVQTRLSSDTIEYRREVVAVLDANSPPGPRSGSIQVRWPSGPELTWPVRWEVESSLVMHPGSLVIDSNEGIVDRSATIRCTLGPFHVKGVSGPAVISYQIIESPDDSAARISLKLDPNLASGLSRIIITTDRPDEREVIANLIISAPRDHQ